MTTNTSSEPERACGVTDRHGDPQHALKADAQINDDARCDPTAEPSNPYASLMLYKRWADDHLLAALLARPGIEDEPQTALIREVVGHFHVVDRIFQAHLRGVPHDLTGTRLEQSLSLTQLRAEIATVDQWLVGYAQSVGSEALAERLSIRLTDGTAKVFSRAEMLLHLSQHGTYHRGNVGVLMRMLGMELPPDRYIDYVADREPRG